jgi:hypothetical protein
MARSKLSSLIVSGARAVQSWFDPGQPPTPQAQSTEGRAFDFPMHVNQRSAPRAGEANTFEALRAFADSYDLLRLVIETRKDQIQSYSWSIVGLEDDGPQPSKRRVKEVTQFLRRPDKEHLFQDWVRALVEDLLVVDAVAVYPRKARDGSIYSFELVDPGTIKRLIDSTGRTPLPPAPAYQQVLKGMVANDLTIDDLYYTMRNYRTNRIYGFSPVEQVIMLVNIALRRQVSQLDYFTAGTIPDALATVPESWSASMIQQFQVWFDSLMETGDTAQRRKLKFMPGGVTLIKPGETILKNEFDEWLARLVCFAFSISPTMLVRETNRATAETVEEVAKDEGVIPLLEFIANHINMMLELHAGIDDCKFAWSMKEATGPKEQMDIDVGYVAAKIRTVDEVRAERGWKPLTEEQKAELAPEPSPGDEPPEAGGNVVPIKSKEEAA